VPRTEAGERPRTRVRLLHSSTFQLSLIYLAFFGTSVLILLSFIYWSNARFVESQADAVIEADLAALTDIGLRDGLPALVDDLRRRLSRKPTGDAIYLVVDADGTLLAGNLEFWPDKEVDARGWVDFDLASIGDKPHRARCRQAKLRDGHRLLVGRDMQDLDALRSSTVRTLWWGLAMTVVVGLIGGTVLSRNLLRRIESINQTSREIMAGDLSRRIPTHETGDDFDQLADNLNRMLAQIDSLMESVRRVSDNIAHDLRTPLARLRNKLELARGEALASGRSAESIELAIVETDDLLATFAALLRIARIEAVAQQEAFEDIRLEDLVRDVAELYEPLAEERGQRFELRLDPGGSVRGDRDLLSQALANLLDNAIKYGPRGGSVAIALERALGETRIAVEDSGPGIAPEFREKVFQRFFRLESGRTSPGNGLGLALVSAVAALHGARVELGDNRPGLRACLVFKDAIAAP
jgi:signal transduction histidine kinase